jgi:uncharacterized membrane protein
MFWLSIFVLFFIIACGIDRISNERREAERREADARWEAEREREIVETERREVERERHAELLREQQRSAYEAAYVYADNPTPEIAAARFTYFARDRAYDLAHPD